jgi:hypothetical protein
VLDLYRAARAKGAAAFFITGRNTLISDATARNLRAVGYTDIAGLTLMANPFADKTAFKTAQRIAIEQQGYTIIANVGDHQDADLNGGHAERTFLVPNPL